MARLARAEVVAPTEIAIVHEMNRGVRRCSLFDRNTDSVPLFGAGFPTPPEPFRQRLQLYQNGWCDLVAHFGRRFFVFAGAPAKIDDTTNRINQHRNHISQPMSGNDESRVWNATDLRTS